MTNRHTYRYFLLGQEVLLLVEQDVALRGVSVEDLIFETLVEYGLSVVPHVLQVVPAFLQSRQTVPQEHVLIVRLVGGHFGAKLLQLPVLGSHVIYFLADLRMLRQQFLCLRETGGRVLAGYCRLRLRQPFLEVVQVLQERLQL